MKRFFYSLLSVGIYLCFLGLIVTTKGQQCIDSKYVDKFDIYSKGRTESVLNCASPMKSKYSEILNQMTSSRVQEINLIMSYLERFLPLKQNLYITIDDDRPLRFEVIDQHIVIGTGLLASKGHLNRAVIKSWVKQFTHHQNLMNSLLDESVADLYYYSIFGELELFDPMTQMQTKIGSAKWPQVLKNLDSYCESSWKQSEDYEKCSELNAVKSDINQSGRKKILTMSLRPLLTSALINSYSSLTLSAQKNVIQNLPLVMQNSDFKSENVIGYLLDQENTLKEGLNVIKLFFDQLNSKRVMQSSQYRGFLSSLNQALSSQGVVDSFAQAYFDFLIEFPDKISTKSAFFKSLEKATYSNLNLQIALKDSDQIWILPSKTGLSLKVFDQIKVKQHVFFACPILKEINMMSFIQTSEKLLMIKGCNPNQNFAFDMLFKYGVPEFSKKENSLSFIQFHLPSLESRINDLSTVSNFFELVEKRDTNQQAFQTLGWQNVQWNENYQYYKPNAVVDAIEYFRVDSAIQN